MFGGAIFGLADEHGNPVAKTPFTHPYNYDDFVSWRGGPNERVNGSTYSDRLRQWDEKKYNELCLKHFGNTGHQFYLNDRKPKQIEAFLRDYTNDQGLELIYIMQGCNKSSGQPIWTFLYRSSDAAQKP